MKNFIKREEENIFKIKILDKMKYYMKKEEDNIFLTKI